MLRAGSVAVVGASGRPGSVGELTLRQLRDGGFEGSIYPVNPGYDSLLNMPCHPEIGAIGEAIDLAVLAVANAHIESEVDKAIAAGAKSLAIYASCHGTASDGRPLRERIVELAEKAGAPICGGNGMGFVNVEDNLRICGFYQPEDLRPGGIVFLSHSGSLFSAMLHNGRGLAFNLAVSTGLELNTPMSDYLNWALDLDSTRVVALFMETIRDPDGFARGLGTARDRGIPVVALKVGTSARGQAAVATHSEAIAGDDAAYEALFDTYDVHRVLTMDEMADTVELLAAGRRPFAGGLGVVHDSGGERALLIDTAERAGVPLPDVSPRTAETLAGLLDPGLEPQNPVDAWGTGRDSRQVFASCLDALASDPGIGVVAFCVDMTREENEDDVYGAAVLEAARGTEKPIAVLANMSTTVDRRQAGDVRAGGIPVLQGTETGLRAIGHLLDRAERLNWPVPQPRLTIPGPLDDPDPFRLLENYGVAVAQIVHASNLDEAIAGADEIGYPVVLKTIGADHKSEVNGVKMGIRDELELEVAYTDLAARLGAEVSVSEQIDPGVEIGVGMITDPQFGPVVIVSAGGTLIELLADRVALLPPVDVFRARRAIGRLVVSKALRGMRGSAPVDIDALAETVARFSELTVDCAGVVASIDLNPVIVGPNSAIVVDVLFQSA